MKPSERALRVKNACTLIEYHLTWNANRYGTIRHYVHADKNNDSYYYANPLFCVQLSRARVAEILTNTRKDSDAAIRTVFQGAP